MYLSILGMRHAEILILVHVAAGCVNLMLLQRLVMLWPDISLQPDVKSRCSRQIVSLRFRPRLMRGVRMSLSVFTATVHHETMHEVWRPIPITALTMAGP